jgi:N-acetylglucosaminyldiphosphoundecaprenol N-acetyl-beta-D-mannosaminyltransferase
LRPREDHLSRERYILGMRVDATSYEAASQRIIDWGTAGESRYVCVATVNNVMEARDDTAFLQVMNEADLVTADGMPLVWGLRWLGIPSSTRVYGPDLTASVLHRAERHGVRVGFLGGSVDLLAALLDRVSERWPELDIAYASSPPFRLLTEDEDDQLVREINDSGVQVLFVGLGCPKQELWMARHRGHVNAPMVGVGAAFSYLAGQKRQAPPVLRRAGLEWLFRLVIEPGRLWRRYLGQNPRFAALFAVQLAREFLFRSSNGREEEDRR